SRLRIEIAGAAMMIYLQKRVIDQNGRSPSSTENSKIRCGMTDTVDNIDVLSESNASRAIRTLDAGMKQLGVQRSQIGAQANSLEARGRSLSTSHENLSAARARIRDADIASESARMVRVQIMQQASASILSQANSRPKLALSLLQ
ncbi:flagellin, partial [Aeromonas caviae]|uniref:flagellin n=1 Tax=Aeromonas caviae TaxID=648 RepID=UPI002B24C18C